jgi:hypothetical protein
MAKRNAKKDAIRYEFLHSRQETDAVPRVEVVLWEKKGSKIRGGLISGAELDQMIDTQLGPLAEHTDATRYEWLHANPRAKISEMQRSEVVSWVKDASADVGVPVKSAQIDAVVDRAIRLEGR